MKKVAKVVNKAFSVRGKLRFAANAGTALATATLRDQEHVIVPCVMLVEGVLHSSNQTEPALALASEFGAIPQGWDGRPVVYNHPVVNGEAVSANRPAGWEEEVIGMVFNTGIDEKKLNAELWLDTSRAPEAVLEGLRNGQEFEVSTGLFALSEAETGFHNGERYSQVWRNIVPDHLAILEPGSIGACSIEDGCGTFQTNKRKFETYMNKSAQNLVSSGSSTAKAKEDEDAAGAGPCGCQDKQGNAIMNMMPKAIQLAVNKFLSKFKSNELSDNDIRKALQVAINSLESLYYTSIEAVFSDNVVFSAMDTKDYEWRMYKMSYSVAEGGAITLGMDMVEVRPETSFVPVVIAEAEESAEETMPISNLQSKGQQMDLNPAQLAELATQVAAQIAANNSTNTNQPASAASAASESNSLVGNMEELSKVADPTFAASVQDSLAYTNGVRATYVASLVAKGFTEAELKGILLSTLSRMASAPAAQAASGLNVVDFSGAGGRQQAINANAESNFTAPSPVFPKKTA